MTAFRQEPTVPCPHCGSGKRAIHLELTDNLKLTDHFAATLSKDGEIRAFTESPRAGAAAAARYEAENVVQHLSGQPPQNEEDTLHVCRRLIRVLNQAGGEWSDPVEGDEPADCVARLGPDERLEVQVVRADSSQRRWKSLAATGQVDESASPKMLADDLFAAIQKKAADRRIPPQLRSGLILALDATRVPGHALPVTVQAFKERHPASIGQFGFREVWVVGPDDGLVERLDREA